MKAYKYNLIIQTILLLSLISLLIWAVFVPGIFLMILYLQLLLGIIQYLSGWVLKFIYPDDQLIKVYLITASTEIAACFLAVIIAKYVEPAERLAYLAYIIAFGIPWCLAIFYWYISFKNTKYIFFKKSIFQ